MLSEGVGIRKTFKGFKGKKVAWIDILGVLRLHIDVFTNQLTIKMMRTQILGLQSLGIGEV